MCCTNGPDANGLKSCSVSARPTVYTIEPTGLGHLEEVIATLSGFNQKTIH